MYSDHKPLQYLFSESHRPNVVPLPGDLVLLMEALAETDSPVTVTTIRSATTRDGVLSKVRELGMVSCIALLYPGVCRVHVNFIKHGNDLIGS